MIFTATGVSVSANGFTKYQAVDVNNPIAEVLIEESMIYVTINAESDESLELIHHLVNFPSAATTMINPDSNAEQIAEQQEELGIDFNSIQDQLNLDSNPNNYDVINQIERLTPGIYNDVKPFGQIVFKISQPEIVEEEDSLRVELFGENILTFEQTSEGTSTYNGYDLNLE